jgi:hypothetical protein
VGGDATQEDRDEDNEAFNEEINEIGRGDLTYRVPWPDVSRDPLHAVEGRLNEATRSTLNPVRNCSP